MKIEKIHVNKIKVTFTPEDLIEHNITPEAVRDNAPPVQRVLMNIVRQAEEKVGFTAENAKLMVEAMPGEGDSMVMYITKLTAEEDLTETLNAVKRKLKLRVRTADAPLSHKLCVTFEDIEDAVSLAHFSPDTDEGTLYFYKGKYHLIIDSCHANRFSEFGRIFTEEGVCNLICEHGKRVCDRALETLRNNF